MKPFAEIRARAAQRKGGEAALAALIGPLPDNAALAQVPDDRVLAAMAQRIFAAGFVWSVIESKWPGFEEALLGFESKRLVF
ncbi:MAG TPA: DNA-3-methyladenine glycosylase I, partial [Aquamicrobium sp.]|nr:DNA-3-methyladenine glycosylase I [Aquamicrobium sp.]